MEKGSPPDIFLSYCRKDEAIVNRIDTDFAAIGIRLKRDIRDIPYGSNVRDFMDRAGTSDYVLIIISDSFLKSKYCMYEVTQLLQSPGFMKRILPVLLPDIVTREKDKEYIGTQIQD